jgi:subtilisin family serine protease
MGCCNSKQKEITRPSVIRKSATLEKNELPLSILLTGGQKLRESNLTGRGVKVAVIDSGVDKDHPGFNGQVKKQVWYRKGTPLEEDDHGTHVAGTVHLMAPQAEIYDYRVFGSEGKLDITDAIAKAIRDAADEGCHVINMSLGGPYPSPPIQSAVKYAASKGVILVCAAGNEGDNNPLTNEISYPAYYEECMCIAAVSIKEGLPVAVFSNSNVQVDYAGIGVDVISFKPGNGFQSMSGTSMASPHVCGLICCLMTDGRIKNDDKALRKILNESYAIDINAVGIDNATGVGFLTYLDKDVFNALLPKEGGLIPAKVT